MSKQKDKPLNLRQQSFAENYTSGPTKGNATQSAVKAGYTLKYAVQAASPLLLENTRVKAVIDAKVAEMRSEGVASREERQEWWTRVYKNKLNGIDIPIRDRLRASELLGKSFADFIDKIVSVDDTSDTVPKSAKEIEGAKAASEAYNRIMSRGHDKLGPSPICLTLPVVNTMKEPAMAEQPDSVRYRELPPAD